MESPPNLEPAADENDRQSTNCIGKSGSNCDATVVVSTSGHQKTAARSESGGGWFCRMVRVT